MPDWLPETAVVSPWTESTYEMLYAIFCRDIRDYNLRYISHPVWIFLEMEDGKENVFWHLTTRIYRQKKISRRKRKFYPSSQTDTEPQRLPDLRRCERLPWVKPLIEHASEPEILAWDYEEGNRTIKTYIWIKDYDFVVIMKKYPDGRRRLITSFHVDKTYKRQDFKRRLCSEFT
jgi:hypothetical protein